MRTTKIIHPQDANSHEISEQASTATDVYIWGSNHQGQLGLGSQYTGKTHISPRPWSFSMAIAQVSCGEEHTAFVTLRGQVYTLGSNLEGRLGLGSRSVKQSSTPCLVESLIKFNCLQISCGWGHTVALMDSGDVFTWGVGEHGALGTGSIENSWAPERVSIDNQNVLKIVKVSAGTKHTAFISDTGLLYACGTGETGQLGTGRRDRELSPVHISLISEKVRDVACGPFHTLILTERGKVYATGGNTLGQLGVGNKKSSNIPIRIKDFDFERIVRVACGHHSAALNERGELFVWGTGVFGEALTPFKFSDPGIALKEISLGSFFGAALDDRGCVWTWGTNSNGELGLGSHESRNKITHNLYFDDKNIESLVCGGSFAVALGRTSKVNKGSPRRSSLSPHRSFVQNPTESYESPGRKHSTPKLVKPRVNNVSYDIDVENPESEKSKEKGILKRSSLRGVSMDRSSKSAKKETTQGILDESPERLQNKRSEVRAHMKESMVKTEDSLVELLVKQKGVLEKCLKDEREEKRILELSLKELKKRLRDLHDGPGGFSNLSEALNKQAKKFDDLKQVYEEEARKREKLTRELNDERKVIREQNHTLIEKEEAILILKKKLEAVEMHSKEISREMEEMRQSLLNENRKLKVELDNKHEALINLDRALEGSRVENVEKKNIINRLEVSINHELEEKRGLEEVSRNLTTTVHEGKNHIEDLSLALQQEKEARADLEKELEASMQREESCQAHARQLLSEVEHLRNVVEQNMIHEHENNARMLQDQEALSGQLNEKEGETQELKAKIGALEQDLREHQEKNKKLLGILSNEIEKQADEFKKKTYLALVKPAGRLAENIVRASKEGGNEEYEGFRGSKQKSMPEGSPLVRRQEFVNQGENSFGSVMPNWNNNNQERHTPMYTGGNTPIKGGESYYSTVREPNFNNISSAPLEGEVNDQLDLERLRKELYEDKSTVESRMQGSPDPKGYGNMSRYGDEAIDRSYRVDEGPRASVKFTESIKFVPGSLENEDARTKLHKSANKLRSILDIGDNNEGLSRSEYMGKSVNVTPKREERRRTPERITNSNSRGKSVSPIKNVPTFRDKEAQNTYSTQDTTHLQSLREVKQRLEMLQKNKQALEDKMQDYEKKVKTGNH